MTVKRKPPFNRSRSMSTYSTGSTVSDLSSVGSVRRRRRVVKRKASPESTEGGGFMGMSNQTMMMGGAGILAVAAGAYMMLKKDTPPSSAPGLPIRNPQHDIDTMNQINELKRENLQMAQEMEQMRYILRDIHSTTSSLRDVIEHGIVPSASTPLPPSAEGGSGVEADEYEAEMRRMGIDLHSGSVPSAFREDPSGSDNDDVEEGQSTVSSEAVLDSSKFQGINKGKEEIETPPMIPSTPRDSGDSGDDMDNYDNGFVDDQDFLPPPQ